jgi:hypothetical protein
VFTECAVTMQRERRYRDCGNRSHNPKQDEPQIIEGGLRSRNLPFAGTYNCFRLRKRNWVMKGLKNDVIGGAAVLKIATV